MRVNKILLFGAGKSATVLIDYLLNESAVNNWHITVADADLALVESKTGKNPNCSAIGLDINDVASRQDLIRNCDIVISMMPPALHIMIARDCIEFKKSLLTASYADTQILTLKEQVEQAGLLFLCEMGLDPGIDHMSAMAILDEIKEAGGNITSFKSHCGGLVAPENDDNPWHYKISWNPRNVVLAGKAGALYRENGNEVELAYENLFAVHQKVSIKSENNLSYSYYPNRNSLTYIDLYQLPNVSTFIRTTLRHPEFMAGWSRIVSLYLTDETQLFESDGKSLNDFFQFHFARLGFDWNAFKSASEKESNLLLRQLLYLGVEDDKTLINKGTCSPADVLQFALEKKLVLHPSDKDLIVMLHEIEYELLGGKYEVQSSLVVTGKDYLHTAMAQTVGLPLGIAAKMILNGTITLKGIQIPTQKEIYEPVLKELANMGIAFKESRNKLN